MSYGKINKDTNFLMSSYVQHDVSWLPLSDFATDEHGNYYSYYIDPQTPDVQTMDNIRKKELFNQMIDNLNAITFEYNNNTFTGSLECQSQMTVAIMRFESSTETKSWYTIDYELMHFTKDDFINMLQIIDDRVENIKMTYDQIIHEG